MFAVSTAQRSVSQPGSLAQRTQQRYQENCNQHQHHHLNKSQHQENINRRAKSPSSHVINSLRSHRSIGSPTLRSAGNSTLPRNSLLTMDPISLELDDRQDNSVGNANRPISNRRIAPNANANAAGSARPRSKVSSNLLPTFVLELLSLACIASFAYFLRFTDSFPILTRGFFCDDPTISYPLRPSFGLSASPIFGNMKISAFYGISAGVPILIIILTETGRTLFSSTNRQTITAVTACVTCRVHLLTRRCFRFIGAFLFGLLMTSIITDILKLTIGKFRPYFLAVCNPEACQSHQSNETGNLISLEAFNKKIHRWISPGVNDEVLCQSNEASLLRQSRMSFPSSSASIASFAGFFIIFYISWVITLRSGQMIRSIANAAVLVAVLLLCASRIITHENHVEDALASLGIGSVFAWFISVEHLNFFGDYCYDEEKTGPEDGKNKLHRQDSSDDSDCLEKDDAWFWRNFHIPRVNHLIRRSIRLFNRKQQTTDTASNGTMISTKNIAAAYVNPAFDHKEFDQQDVDRNRRPSYHDPYKTRIH